MKQLSGLDATFLYLETPQMPMHVGALHVFELPEGFRGRFVTALRAHIATRLPIAPVLRRRLWWMPLNLAAPAWVDAEPKLAEHIVEVKVKKGASMEDLHAEVARLHPVLLDRTKPLWKFHVFEGLAHPPGSPRRVAMYTQLHHAAVDGQAAVALANAILDTSPEPRAIEARASGRPRTFKLEMTEMLRGVLALQAQKVGQIARDLPETIGTLSGAAKKALLASRLMGGEAAGGLSLAPRIAVNANVTEGRAFATAVLPLSEVQAVRRGVEASINDVVLFVCGGAMRRYLGRRKALPKKSLVAAVPVSLREKGDTTADNQASMSLVSLGTHLADPQKRLAHVMAATRSMKATMGSLKSVLPTDFPSLGVPWLLEAATSIVGRAKLGDRVPAVANVVISNVPGPPVLLYLAGARMLTNFPCSIIVHGMGLNITVQSYAGSLDFGLMADAEAMPDVAQLAADIAVAFDDLKALVAEEEAEPTIEEVAGAVAKRAARGAGSLFGRAMDAAAGTVGKVAGSAVKAAVGGAVGGVVGNALGRRSRAPKAAATPPDPQATPRTRGATAKRAVSRR
jgi:WS/DGAT/MGAT family acyltransferase